MLPDVLFAGVSEEDIQLDVGHCHKSCRSLFTLIDPDFADLESSVFKVSLSSLRHPRPRHLHFKNPSSTVYVSVDRPRVSNANLEDTVKL
jgi:hypothetical protein